MYIADPSLVTFLFTVKPAEATCQAATDGISNSYSRQATWPSVQGCGQSPCPIID